MSRAQTLITRLDEFRTGEGSDRRAYRDVKKQLKTQYKAGSLTKRQFKDKRDNAIAKRNANIRQKHVATFGRTAQSPIL